MFAQTLKRPALVVFLVAAIAIGAFAPAAAADDGQTHIVKYGETLNRIARMYGVIVADIVEANSLANANTIYSGQELAIPGTAAEYFEHTVVSGESLLTISAKYGVSVWDIARLSGLWNTNLIYVGQVLRIPGEGTTAPDTDAGDDGAEDADEMPTMQEAIIISSPAFNEEVTGSLEVTGWGSGFENNLAVDVLDETGNVLGQGYVIVAAEMGQMGKFTGTVEYTAPATSQLGRISVYSISPRDGAIEHLASVTVRLVP